MQPTDKFRTDLDQAAHRARDRGEAAEIDSIRNLFYRSFPKIGDETKAAIFESYVERRRRSAGEAMTWLAGVGSIFFMDYDGTPFETADWEEIREAVALEEDKLDMELLQYAMSLVVDHGAL